MAFISLAAGNSMKIFIMIRVCMGLFIFQCAVISCNTAKAQSQPADTIRKEIPEVIITATRTPENPDSLGRSITVITADEINQLQSNDLAQLLSLQQGISITGAGQNPGMTETIFMRGTNSNHTLIMIDGVRMSDPSSVNGAPDLAEIPVSGFDRIEIVRGSHSTLYGSSCIGGVINLITAGRQSPGFNTNASLRSGVFGANTFLLEENLHMNYSWKNGLYAGIDFFHNRVQGLDATIDTITNPDAFKSFDHDHLSLLKASGKIGFENSKWNLFATYGITDQKTDFDKAGWKYHNSFGANPQAYYDGDSNKIFTRRNLVTYGASRQVTPAIMLSFNGGFTSLSREVIEDSSVIDNAGTSDQTYSYAGYSGKEMNHDLVMTASLHNLKLIAGAGWSYESMTDTLAFFTNTFYGPFISASNIDSLNLHADLYHVYLQAEANGGILNRQLSALNLIAGMRYNHHTLFGDEISYEVNPFYHVTKEAMLYASFSSGFNAPSLYQLYSPESDYTSQITRGNPDLKPEISHSLEFGFKQQMKQFHWAVSVYSNIVKNEIEYVFLWDKDTPVDSIGNDFTL
ncbi:MAG: TonB-dependent receptor, partial [Chitinophagales bacterium]